MQKHLQDSAAMMRQLLSMLPEISDELRDEAETLMVGLRALAEGHPTPIRPRASGIILKDKQLLCMIRQKGNHRYVALPGGGIDPGETPQSGCIREVYEETTLQIAGLQEVRVLERRGVREHIFLIREWRGKPTLSGDEAIGNKHGSGGSYQLAWLNWSEASQLMSETLREAIEPVIEKETTSVLALERRTESTRGSSN